MYEHIFNTTQEAIKAIKDNEISRISIKFNENLSPEKRKSEIQSLSDFIATNPPSLTYLDFSKCIVPKGNVAALNKEETEILLKGIEKNTFLRGVQISNWETYKTFAGSPKGVDQTGSFMPQEDKSKIKDTDKHEEYKELHANLLPYLDRNFFIEHCIDDITMAVVGGKIASSILLNNKTSA